MIKTNIKRIFANVGLGMLTVSMILLIGTVTVLIMRNFSWYMILVILGLLYIVGAELRKLLDDEEQN